MMEFLIVYVYKNFIVVLLLSPFYISPKFPTDETLVKANFLAGDDPLPGSLSPVC